MGTPTPSLEQLAASLAQARAELDALQDEYTDVVTRQQSAEDRVAELVAEISMEADGDHAP